MGTFLLLKFSLLTCAAGGCPLLAAGRGQGGRGGFGLKVCSHLGGRGKADPAQVGYCPLCLKYHLPVFPRSSVSFPTGSQEHHRATHPLRIRTGEGI